MRTKFNGILTLFLALIVQISFAQERTISGTVSDESGPLPGVTILKKGTVTGTETDFDGNYTIKAKTGDILVFSFVGMKTSEKLVGESSQINVVLTGDNVLDEIVVTGVGSATSKRKTAIAVESVTSEDLKPSPAGDVSQALVGKVPGALIQSTSGQPGQQQSILLRGINSLSSTQPMIMVDGIQINTDNIANGSDNNLSSRLADLDLADVERIEVIQGAAAGTIYGAQGANGVIQIFTKKGKAGKIKVNLKSTLGLSYGILGDFGISDKHYFETTTDGFLAADSAGNRLLPDPTTGVWGTPIGTIGPNTLVNKPFAEQTYDNLDLLLKDGAVTKNIGVSVSGGSEKIQFATNLSHLNQESIINGSLKRINFRNNITANITDKLKASFSTTIISSSNTTGGVTNSNNVTSGFSNSILVPQYVNNKALNANGRYVSTPTGDNSVNPFFTFQNRTYESDLIRAIGNINLNYKPFHFLELDYKYGADIYQNDYRRLTLNQSELLRPGLSPFSGELFERPDKGSTQNSLASAFIRLNFEDDFGFKDFPLNTTTHLAYDWRREDFKRISVIGTNLPTYSKDINMNQTGNQTASAFDSTFRTFGFLVNQKFEYGNLFGLSAGVRVDWSSTFGQGSDAFVFPRGDVYIRVDSFINKNWLDQLKLRAAYGEAGIQPGPFDRIPILDSGQIQSTPILSLPTTLRNANLGVQTSKELEFGTDITFKPFDGNWFNRVGLSATYYTRKSEDVIRAIDISPSTGASAILTNALSIDTDGTQIALDLNVADFENFNWSSAVNFGTFESTISDIANDADITLGNNHVLREGAPIGAFFGKEVLTSLTQTRSDGTRYIPDSDLSNYEIVNGYVVETATRRAIIGDEQVLMGDPTPDFNMSFINSFSYKNFDLSFQLDWVQGNDIYNQTRQWLYRDLLHKDVTQPLSIGGTSGAYAAYYTNLYATNEPISEFVEDGSFVRLRNLSFSFDAGGYIKGVSSLKLTLSGNNLFTWTNYSGMDPEAASNLNSSAARGLDQYAFPNFRTYSLGVNVNF